MQEIKCPNCGEVFQVDESGYAQIVQQVRDKEFAEELERREQELNQKKENDITIARMEQEKSHNEELSRKDSELAERDHEIERLKAQLDKANTERKLAVSEATQEKEKELSDKVTESAELKGPLSSKETEMVIHISSIMEILCLRTKISEVPLLRVSY